MDAAGAVPRGKFLESSLQPDRGWSLAAARDLHILPERAAAVGEGQGLQDGLLAGEALGEAVRRSRTAAAGGEFRRREHSVHEAPLWLVQFPHQATHVAEIRADAEDPGARDPCCRGRADGATPGM